MSGVEVIIGVVGATAVAVMGGKYAVAKTAYKCAKYLVKKALKKALSNEDFDELKSAIEKIKEFEEKYGVEKITKYIEKYAYPIAEKLGIDIEELKEKLETIDEHIDNLKEKINIANDAQEKNEFVEAFKQAIDKLFEMKEKKKLKLIKTEEIIIETGNDNVLQSIKEEKREIVQFSKREKMADLRKKRNEIKQKQKLIEHSKSRPKRPVQ